MKITLTVLKNFGKRNGWQILAESNFFGKPFLKMVDINVDNTDKEKQIRKFLLSEEIKVKEIIKVSDKNYLVVIKDIGIISKIDYQKSCRINSRRTVIRKWWPILDFEKTVLFLNFPQDIHEMPANPIDGFGDVIVKFAKSCKEFRKDNKNLVERCIDYTMPPILDE